MPHRRAALALCVALTLRPCLYAQETQYPSSGQQIPGPDKPADFPDWIADIQRWRSDRRVRIGFDGATYSRPEFQWTQSNIVQTLMIIEDRYFYDSVAGKYTVDRYLDDLERRFGGIDSVLIWHVYPNIGIDDRNQYDHLRDMPGGIAALKQAVGDFHRRGVKVFLPVLLWERGTRNEGQRSWTAVTRLAQELGADGLFGDSTDQLPKTFLRASEEAGRPLALEPELTLPDGALGWDILTWGYWHYSWVPSISKYKWLETRHLVHICRRWARDRSDDLQHAFFNGTGFEAWENIWGIWNQMTPRDAEALRRIAKIERAFADLLASPEWEPHTPTLRYGVFASKFPGQRQTLWTLVNRNEYDVRGEQIRVPRQSGARYFDVWHGAELKPVERNDSATCSFDLEAHGYGAVLALREGPVPSVVSKLFAEMREISQTPLNSLSAERPVLTQHLVEILPTQPAASAPEDMVRIPGGDFRFEVEGIEIEGENETGVDVQYPWEDSPRRFHLHTLHLKPFYIDRYPVTNAQFQKFLEASRYEPRDTHNFLRGWKDGTYPDGWANKPVTWVSLEDARAYAAWAGKRLPHEWEWQYAAQGMDGRIYPWGNEWVAAAVPPPDNQHTMHEPTDVSAYPRGASPFGVMDMVGNIWQWTDEYVDEHTRAAVLRGGSFYQPQGSMWYFPQAYKLSQHGKYLLMAPSRDRSGTVGFRCVRDAD